MPGITEIFSYWLVWPWITDSLGGLLFCSCMQMPLMFGSSLLAHLLPCPYFWKSRLLLNHTNVSPPPLLPAGLINRTTSIVQCPFISLYFLPSFVFANETLHFYQFSNIKHYCHNDLQVVVFTYFWGLKVWLLKLGMLGSFQTFIHLCNKQLSNTYSAQRTVPLI